MAQPASSVRAVPEAEQPDQLPLSPRLTLTYTLTPAQADNRPRPLDVAECSLCGIAHPLGLLVPDGSPAHTDVRWYCKDVRSCTERWTTARPRRSDGSLRGGLAGRVVLGCLGFLACPLTRV
jgi:hypothetical protein